MKSISEPMIAVGIVVLLVVSFLGKAVFRLISLALVAGLVIAGYYVYKYDHGNLANQVQHLIKSHLPTVTTFK